jgi:hypothetical protein
MVPEEWDQIYGAQAASPPAPVASKPMADITASTTGEWQASKLDQALRDIDAQVDGQAEQIRAHHRSRRTAIQKDSDLNELARRQKLDQERERALGQMREQREAIDNTTHTLLGLTPTDPQRRQLFRDARHRARQLGDANAALDAMRNALADDDCELVEAIASVACDHGWRRVWRAWPEGSAGVEKLYNVRAGADGGRSHLFRFSV